MLLIVNAARMFAALTRGRKIPARLYLKHAGYLILHGVTQMRWRKCNDKTAGRNWLRHLLLVTGYVTIFTLWWCSCRGSRWRTAVLHWTSILGYYATAVLLGATASMML